MSGPHWRDPYRSAKNALILVMLILVLFLLNLFIFTRVKAQSPAPEFPPGTIIGVLYISDGISTDTPYGGILFFPNQPTGVLMLLDENGEFQPAGEVTITYWVEPDTQ